MSAYNNGAPRDLDLVPHSQGTSSYSILEEVSKTEQNRWFCGQLTSRFAS